MPVESAGLLMYRRRGPGLEILLAHPGGPFWANKDEGAWTIPKGQLVGEAPLAAAIREFEEETGLKPSPPYLDLGFITQKAGKVIHGWAFEGDAEASEMRSNTIGMEWPPRSGVRVEIPEVDRCEWFTPEAASRKINPAQATFIQRLQSLLGL